MNRSARVIRESHECGHDTQAYPIVRGRAFDSAADGKRAFQLRWPTVGADRIRSNNLDPISRHPDFELLKSTLQRFHH
jgi:hypothetical protein